MKKQVMSRSAWLRTPGLLAWLRLARVFQQVDRASATFLRRWELSVAQFDALAYIGAHAGCAQQELADGLLVTKGNVSQLVERLERRGVVRRQQDGRVSRLYLTEGGQALAGQVVPAQEEFIAEALEGLEPEEQRQLRALLHKLDRSLEWRLRVLLG